MKLITGISSIITVLWVLSATDLTYSKRLLIIAPTPSYSHQIVFRSLCLGLNKHGHEIVVLTPNILNDSTLINYTEIDFGSEYKMINEIDATQPRLNNTVEEFKLKILNAGNKLAENAFSHPDLMKYYANDSNAKFDAVIVEISLSPAIYVLAHRFNVPLIGIISMSLQNYQRYNLGSPILSSHPSNWELEEFTSMHLPFWKRLSNFVRTWWNIYTWFNYFLNMQQQIAEKYLGKNIPHIADIMKNMSLILINREAALSYPVPEIPNVVYYSGLHISKKPPKLSKDLKRFLDDATNGFIYVSLGSNVKSKFLPKGIQKIFTDVFANLPYRVLWKFENQNDHIPPNVFISKWMPQQGVLAHPNIKLFIYQGGLQSTEEAVHYAVPLIGIPFVFDQVYQVMKMVSLGVAKHLNIAELTAPELHDAIMEVATDKRYRDRMIELYALTKDKPHDSLENLIWWIEYVLRHNGAPHLRFNGVDTVWYQQFDLDLIVFLTIISFLFLCALLFVIGWMLKLLFKQYFKISVRREKKKLI